MTSKKTYSDKEDEYIRLNHDKGESEYIAINHDKADGLGTGKVDSNFDSSQIPSVGELERYNKKVFGAKGDKYFCVFRVGKKFKNIGQIKAFELHMERDMIVPNADSELSKYNKTIIGNSNVTEIVREYIKDVPKIRSNCNIARDLVLTTSHDFFKNLPPQEREKWIQENIKWLKDNFGDNCVYACVHMDETTPHIHSLIVPRFFNEEKKRYELRSNVYFDGIQKMQNWQTQYANYMNSKFDNLIRGVKGSKARHVDIKTYYNLLTKKLDIQDDRQVLAYAKYGFLMQRRMKALERTLKLMEENGDSEKLLKKLDSADKKTEIYRKTIKEITKKYGLKEKEIYELVDKVQSSNKKEREK